MALRREDDEPEFRVISGRQDFERRWCTDWDVPQGAPIYGRDWRRAMWASEPLDIPGAGYATGQPEGGPGRFTLASVALIPSRAATGKQRAIDALIGLLLDASDARSRCIVARQDSPEIFISDPNEIRTGPDDEVVEIPLAHVMTLDQELRWILAQPASTRPESPVVFYPPNEGLLRTQTRNLDRTQRWKWADIRQSRIRKTLGKNADAWLPHPARTDDLAIDRLDLRARLEQLSDGGLFALLRRFAGYTLTPTQRVQLHRARKKTSSPCKRLDRLVRIDSERRSHPVLYWEGFF